ncbi:MAG: hypothetical protein KDF58_11960 [Alphaproteobacteria bacterium]|nr:hypothetical protein [Alphaproteobacteria bacterium]HPF45326.1 hypothetical protein [Emcibacteraceae bacterium]HRW29849.1 hypothetical protein [Emcibacteraceae bacterium]
MKHIFLILSLLLPFNALAETVKINVLDNVGEPVNNAVVSFYSDDKSKNNLPQGVEKPVMVQQGQEFVPHVLPIRLGSSVDFPNKDNFRHMIYSFSKPKRFEVQLYGGEDQVIVNFDKPGVVTLGCNIHDNMLGYIYVLETDNFVKTDETGKSELTGIAPGTYTVSLWHPDLSDNAEKYDREVTIVNGENQTVEFSVNLKPTLTLKNR